MGEKRSDYATTSTTEEERPMVDGASHHYGSFHGNSRVTPDVGMNADMTDASSALSFRGWSSPRKCDDRRQTE
jgi:hypothetical protein